MRTVENLLPLRMIEASVMEITPSILTADFSRLGETRGSSRCWNKLDSHGRDDGNWVVNKTITFGCTNCSIRDRLGPTSLSTVT